MHRFFFQILIFLAYSAHAQVTIYWTLYNQASCVFDGLVDSSSSCGGVVSTPCGANSSQYSAQYYATLTSGYTFNFAGDSCSGGYDFGYGPSWHNGASFSPSSYTVSHPGTFSVSVYVIDTSGAGCGGSFPSMPSNGTSCITLQNSTSAPQYYNFQNTCGTPSNLSGDSSSLQFSINGGPANAGPGLDPSSLLAVYPGESVTVCCTQSFSSAPDGCTFYANQIGCGTDLSGQANRFPELSPDGSNVNGDGSSGLCVIGGVGNGFNFDTTTPTPTNNTPLGTNGPSIASGLTNNIPFNNSTNDGNPLGPWALNTPMEQGFSALYGAASQALIAQNDINNTLLRGFGVLSNELAGLHISNDFVLSNLTFTNSIPTNLTVFVSNQATNLATNGSSGFTNFPTNFPDAAAIADLQSISNSLTTNLLIVQDTNSVSISNRAISLGGGAIQSSAQSLASGLVSSGDSVPTSPDSPLSVTVSDPSGAGDWVFDVDPSHNSDLESAMTYIRQLVFWVIWVVFTFMLIRDCERVSPAASQIQMPKGGLVQAYTSSIFFPIFVTVIMTALYSLPILVIGYITSHGSVGYINVNIFNGTGGVVTNALYLFNLICPVNFLFELILGYLVFRLTLVSTRNIVSGIVMACVS